LNIERDPTLAALRRATDPRGFMPHELAVEIGADEKGRHRLRALLAELLSEGVVEKAEGGRYRIVGWRPTAPPPVPTSPRPARHARAGVAGRIRVHPAGYGFVQRDDGEDDVFVGARNRAGALDGDRVLVETWMGFKGTEGRVVEVLERGRARIKIGRASCRERV
jgi:ribonuclease R